MTPMGPFESPVVLEAIPAGVEWEFGGHPYGLEPLALPAQWLPRTAVDPAPIEELRARLTHTQPASVSHLCPDGADEIDRLFWFRWITAHQTTFLLWQLLAAIEQESHDGSAEPDDLAAQARLLVCGYSLMLMYASSAPLEIYERVIRMPMARQHVNLSGAWARDYAPVRALVRGKVALGSGAAMAALQRECELNDEVHEGIQDRLLPEGVSLLRSPKPKGGRQMHRNSLVWLYDGIFLTSRAAVSHREVARQLVRRLQAVFLDVTANGLHPSFAPGMHEDPPRLRTPELNERKSDLTDYVLQLLSIVGTPARSDHASTIVRFAPPPES
jgi:hypothetical protein